MINILHRAKHWQLFLILVVLPFLIYIVWFTTYISDIVINSDNFDSIESLSDIFDNILYMMLFMMIPVIIQYAWFWSMSIGLQKKLPEGMTMRTGLFKAFFFIPIIYGALYLLFIIALFGNIENIENLENLEDFENFGLLIVGFMLFFGLSLFITFCTFYQYWFIAKTIKSAELQRDVKFSEFVGEFFLVWFSFIGVWILQPTINKLVAEDQPSLK